MSRCDPFHLLHRTLLDTFRVEEFVAEGGYGVVYRGFHEYFRSPVALKVLKVPQGLPEEVATEFWEEFRREAEVQFRLSALTEHVVRPFHVGRVDIDGRTGLPIMVLEWLEGLDLGAEMTKRRRSGLPAPRLRELLDRLSGVARAIHLSHNFEREGGRYSVVHRDIKPENLFVAHVGGKEIVKILDFGTSKVGRLMDIIAGDPTKTGHVGHFSPAYGAPEQWMPSSLGQTGPWTDVWGLALTLVELLKGDHVFSGNMQSVMFRCLNENERPTPRQHGIEVSDAVEAVFLRALAVDPKDRTKSVRDLWLDLRQALADSVEEPPRSFGHHEPVPVRSISESELPFVLVSKGRRRPPPQTGTFPVHKSSDTTDAIRRTGTDPERGDTLRDAGPAWDEEDR